MTRFQQSLFTSLYAVKEFFIKFWQSPMMGLPSGRRQPPGTVERRERIDRTVKGGKNKPDQMRRWP
jgi:hypothetical protein